MEKYSVFSVAILFLINGIAVSNGARILMLLHLCGSHVSEYLMFGSELVNRAHDVYTVVPESSPFIDRFAEKGIRVIVFPVDTKTFFMGSAEYHDYISAKAFGYELDELMAKAVEITNRHCEMILNNDDIVNQLHELNFDIAIVEPFVLNYCHLLIPFRLSIPFINAYAMLPFWDMGIPALPSFVSTTDVQTTDRLTMYETIVNLISHFLFNSRYCPIRQDTDLLHQYAPSLNSWNELYRLTEFTIVYRDEILEAPSPRMPNTLFLPGMTYSPAKPLPKNMEAIFNRAINGVIVVTFGGQINSMPTHIFHKFINVFKLLDGYEVVWKLSKQPVEALPIDAIPKNVHFLEWIPQNDCLGHEKTKLFINHCGNNGQYESLYHGVPMLGFPLFVPEQHHNAFRVTDRGYGLSLNIREFSEEQLNNAISECLINSTILKNVKWASNVLKDRKHPKYEAVYWIEHVTKFGGKHLRGVSMDLPWYKLLMLDLVLLCVMMFVILVTIFWLCIKCMCLQLKSRKYKTS